MKTTKRVKKVKKWKDFSPVWTFMVPAPNPDRKWWQFWKPKYISIPDPNPPKGQYIVKDKKMIVRIKYFADPPRKE